MAAVADADSEGKFVCFHFYSEQTILVNKYKHVHMRTFSTNLAFCNCLDSNPVNNLRWQISVLRQSNVGLTSD